jgi:hypothetical protein
VARPPTYAVERSNLRGNKPEGKTFQSQTFPKINTLLWCGRWSFIEAFLPVDNIMPAETEEQENMQQKCDARGKYGPSPATTECVSSIGPGDEDDNEYTSPIMVEMDGEIRLLGRALLDTGCRPSMMSESTAVEAEAWGLTTIDRSESTKTEGVEMLEGIVKGAHLKVAGKVRLRFSVDGARYYRHTFIVIPNEDRFDLLLGAKFLKRIALVRAKQNSTELLAGRL